MSLWPTPARFSAADHELYIAVLSNAIHLSADNGRVITCPFIPGRLPDNTMAVVVSVAAPRPSAPGAGAVAADRGTGRTHWQNHASRAA